MLWPFCFLFRRVFKCFLSDFIMHFKRGMSRILGIFLIVIVSIAGVSIFFFYLNKFFDDSSQETNVVSELLLEGFSIDSVVLEDGESENNGEKISFTLSRIRGDSEEGYLRNVSGLLVVLYNDKNESFSYRKNISLVVFQSEKIEFTIDDEDFGDVVKIIVLPIFFSEDNRELISSLPIQVNTASSSNSVNVRTSSRSAGGGGSSGGGGSESGSSPSNPVSPVVPTPPAPEFQLVVKLNKAVYQTGERLYLE